MVALVLLWAFAFQPELEANADTERDLLRVLALVRDGIFPAAGPALDHLPLALPPTWYYAVAPVLWISPNPLGIHLAHVLLLGAGVWALARSFGGVSGALVALAFGCSTWALEMLAPVWHPGAIVGLGALWLSAVIGGVTQEPRPAARALVLAWSCAFLGVQFHAVAIGFVPILALVHAHHLWRHRNRGGLWPHLASALLLLGIAAQGGGTLWVSLTDLGVTAGHRGESTASLTAVVATLWALGGASAAVVPGVAPLVLVLAAVGAGSALRAGRSDERALSVALVAQLVVGLVVATRLSSLSIAPRYFGPAIVPLFGLAGLGLRSIARAAPMPRWTTTRAAWGMSLLPLLLMGRLLSPASGERRETAVPSLIEQAAMASGLGELGATISQLGHVHGAAVGPLTALRLLAVADGGWPAGGAPREWFAAVEGFPEPPNLEGRTVVSPRGGRRVALGHFESRFGRVRAIVGERACGLPVPFFWSALRPDELRPFRLAPSFDPERCRSRDQAKDVLQVTLQGPPGATPLTLVLGWFDVARHPEQQATVSGEGLLVEQLTGPLYRDYAVFRVSARGGLPTEFTLLISPFPTSAVLDVY